MSLNKDGIMIILSSPSGAGKTTLTKLLSTTKKFLDHFSLKSLNELPPPTEVDSL